MIVRDIFNSAKDVLGYCDQSTMFERISDAVECLANKGQIDILQQYLTIPVQSSNIVTLPRDVEAPIKVNIDNTPSFSRTKLYEFTMNGPGSTTERTDWSWEDRGGVPVLVQPSSLSIIVATSNNSSDVGLKVWVTGRTVPLSPDTIGAETTEVLTIANVGGVYKATSTNAFSSITRITKDITAGTVALSTVGNAILSIYAPDETEPNYKQIRLSKTGVTARMLVRKSVLRIVSLDDFIPIQSRMALYLMLKANEEYRNGNAQVADALEKAATQKAEEEQKSRNVFSQVAEATESDTARGLNINNRDSVIVADIYDEASKIVGPIGQQKVFDKITDAINTLQNKGQWDGSEGYIDITTDGESRITLPRYVDYILGINLSGSPSEMKNRFFEFHLNGPGTDCSQPCGTWTDEGDVVTLVDRSYTQQLVYVPDNSADNGSLITIYGYDENGTWIRSGGSDGFTIAASTSKVVPVTGDQKVSRIERITRASTAGFCTLTGFSLDYNTASIIGYYYPDETEPTYRRIRIPYSACWARIRYRRRTTKITSLTDPIHLKSRRAVLTMLRSIEAVNAGNIQLANDMEIKSVQYLAEEKMARNPLDTFVLQFDRGTSMSSPEHDVY